MNKLVIAFSRTYQLILKVAANFLNFREPEIINSIDALPAFIKKQGLDNVLVVTDDVLHNKLNMLDGLKEGLEKEGIKFVVFDKTVPNPTIDNIEEAYGMYLDNGCKGIIAFGGGSPMDCAKGVGCRVVRPNTDISKLKGVLKVWKKLPPLVAIPTTAGTGSEATIAAVISNAVTHEKYPINDPVLIPKYAVLDPALTLKLPKHITSTTGVDALTHAVEAYIGRAGTARTDEMALKATKLIFENVKKAYDDGSDIEARKNMQFAAYYAGIAFTRAYVGLVHAMAHTLGGYYKVPHGLANAIILPYVLDFYGETAYAKLAEMADVAQIGGVCVEEKAKNFIQAIRDLNASMGIPDKVDGILDKDIPMLVHNAYKEAVPLYPQPKLADKEDITKLFALIKK